MKTLSTSSSSLATSTRALATPAPNVVHGLAYGVIASLLLWTIIAVIIYNLA